MNRLFTTTILSLFGGLIIAPIFVFAQTEPETIPDQTQSKMTNYNVSINANDIETLITPEFPGAFQNVSIRLDSNTVDLNRYFIDWLVDGVSVQSDIGSRTLNTTSGDYGATRKIGISINLGTTTVRKDIFISPQDATVLWEAIDSYVPPFYRGKKLASQESLIKISAIPNFRTNNSLSLDDAVFLWSRNGNKLLNTGGYGKNSIVIQHNRLRKSELITAEISNTSGGSSAKKTLTIPITDPEIHWYTKNLSNYRRLNSVDNGLRVKTGDTKLVAEPYFFSYKQNPSELTTSWLMNSQQIYLDPDSLNRELLIRNPNQEGQTNFSVNFINPKTFLQDVSRSVSLYFEKPSE